MMSANTGRTMLPLHSLLNPSPGRQVPQPRQASPALSSSSSSVFKETTRATTEGNIAPNRRLSRNSTMAKSKPQGPINFSPFEDIDPVSFQELSRFRVSPFGQIQQCCEHIPYNSSKKDFFEKTGRESIEVFKYEFRLPGEEDGCYTVMWDYNVGLVRMTPFFKCLGYPKTKPSQMLDKNPGLRDISPSVTGGAVAAQGYWMPYRCAKAICATFCYHIAGALIPVFGPSFPSECTPPDSPYYKEMVISQQIVIEDTRDVDRFRHDHKNRIAVALNGASSLARLGSYTFRGKHDSESNTTFRLGSHPQSFWTPINGADSYRGMAASAPTTGYGAQEFGAISRTGPPASSFANRPGPECDPFQSGNPFLSALPRMRTEEPQGAAFTEKWRPKRRRRAHDGPKRDYPAAAAAAVDMGMGMDIMAKKTEKQDLDRLKAAAALVSLQRETRCSTAVMDSSEDDSPRGAGTLHHKKRPKSHSF